MRDLYWLTDEQMARFAPYFLKNHDKPMADDRRVLMLPITLMNPGDVPSPSP